MINGVCKCWSTPKISHGKLELHVTPPVGGNTGPACVQLSCDPSSDSTRNELIEPFPGVTPSAAVVGFKFSPPPLNANVRIDGCSKISPPAARTTVFPEPKTSHATPSRGDTLL